MKANFRPFALVLCCASATAVMASCVASSADDVQSADMQSAGATTPAKPPAKLRLAVAPGAAATATDNLWAAPPATEFWYPPYAAAQPQWNGGVLKLDLNAAKGQEMAVLSFKLPETLKKGADYTLRFLAKSSQVAPLVVLVPQPKTGEKPGADGKILPADSWAQHSTGGQINSASALREINFKYSPDELEADKIQLFWDKAAVDEATQWTFSNFSLMPAGAPAPALRAATETPDLPMNADFKASAATPFAAQFWYPPHADRQPQWNKGEITVNLDEPKNKGQKMAALTLKLPADMEQDADYRIRFDAVSSAGGPMVIQVPEPDARGEKEDDKSITRGDWQMHSPGSTKKRSIVFVNRPQLTVGGPQITLFWGDDSIAKGGTWQLSNFEFKKMD